MRLLEKFVLPALIFLAASLFWLISDQEKPADPPGWKEMVLRKKDRPSVALFLKDTDIDKDAEAENP